MYDEFLQRFSNTASFRPRQSFFFWSLIVAMSRGRMKPFQKCENDKIGALSKYVNQVLWLVILTNFTTLLLKTMNNICSFPSGRESLSPEHLKASTAPVKVTCFSSFFIPLAGICISWSFPKKDTLCTSCGSKTRFHSFPDRTKK